MHWDDHNDHQKRLQVMFLLAVVGTQEEVMATGSDTFSLFAVLVYSVSVVVASRRLFIWPVQCTPCSVSWTAQGHMPSETPEHALCSCFVSDSG